MQQDDEDADIDSDENKLTSSVANSQTLQKTKEEVEEQQPNIGLLTAA